MIMQNPFKSQTQNSHTELPHRINAEIPSWENQTNTYSSPSAIAVQNVQEKHQYAPIPLSEIQLNPNLLNTDPTNNGYR